MQILIFGGSGGIGLALVRQALQRDSSAHINATYHRTPPSFTHPQLTWHKVDVTSETQLQALSQTIPKLDWIINCVGILHDGKNKPEKNFAGVTAEWFLQSMAINALPTLLIAKYFTPNLKRSAAPKMAVLSARVGSISDNRLGGWYSYRSSKAALNMLVKGISIEWKRVIPSASIVALHPGTTDTKLSLPFQANVPEGKLFTPDYVAQCLFTRLYQLTPEQSGHFFAYDGSAIDL